MALIKPIRKSILAITAAALVLTGAACVRPALAYFTDFTSADGRLTVNAGETTTRVKERFSNMTKQIVITNTGDNDSYIRVAALAAEQYELTVTWESGWTDGGDGYYYYDEILPAGGETTEIDVQITIPKDSEGNEITDDFSVVILQEATRVYHDAEGRPYADWTETYTLSTGEGGEE